MKLWWRILHRFYGARARRASRKAVDFMAQSEKFYRYIKGAR